MRFAAFSLGFVYLASSLPAQTAHVRPANPAAMPAQVDSNSPAFRIGGAFHLLNSTGDGPKISAGSDQFHLSTPRAVHMANLQPWPTWIESVWADPDTGELFGWYHREPLGVCPGTTLTAPRIGAAVSFDSGQSWIDMGDVITQGDPANCNAGNGYFAGGTGDVSVILDRDRTYFYFFFGVYGGPVAGQGVGVARMSFASRFSQSNAVMKWYGGAWLEPGLNGRISPIFPAKVGWQRPNTDAFWGPSIHWNTYLNEYVMLLNRSCCSPGFPQKGIYASFNPDLSKPASWTQPDKILSSTGWYPQVLGLGVNDTDREAGRVARLYVYGHSTWEIVFAKPTDPPPAP